MQPFMGAAVEEEVHKEEEKEAFMQLFVMGAPIYGSGIGYLDQRAV